ncbi:MAG: multiheme c-type cytochrome [Pseudomonadales bacterium]
MTVPRYVGSQGCRSCHEQQYVAWSGSNHSQAERMLSRELDAVAFEPSRSFEHGTQQSSVLHSDGRTQEGLLALERAQVVMPTDPSPAYARATILYGRGELDAALAATKEALRIYPDYSQARNLAKTVQRQRISERAAENN